MVFVWSFMLFVFEYDITNDHDAIQAIEKAYGRKIASEDILLELAMDTRCEESMQKWLNASIPCFVK
jgi:hypothetical protein